MPPHHRLPRLRAPPHRCHYSHSTTSIAALPPTATHPPTHPLTKLTHALTLLQHTPPASLALRSCDQPHSPIRIGILGDAACILPPLLLADETLRTELQEWAATAKPGRGLLVRFGHELRITTPAGSPLMVLVAPVDALRANNVELVVSLGGYGSDPLVPVFVAKGIPGARVIEYPVHKALVFAGAGGVGVARLVEELRGGEEGGEGGGRVLRVVSVPGAEDTGSRRVWVVDLAQAEAVDGIRVWLLSGTTRAAGEVLKPAVTALIADIFSSARTRLAKMPPPHAVTQGEPPEVLAHAITAWSKAAHLELKHTTEAAFAGHEWKKLAWWKLLWRVDDIGTVSRHVVGTAFLPHSEAAATFLAGRLHGAGFRSVPAQRTTSTGDVVEVEEEEEVEQRLPAPAVIPAQREEILATLVPALQSGAQRYLLASMSTSGLSGVMSALLWLSDVPVYSALTVAAVGTVGSARWLQSRWMREQRGFREGVRERGREAIVDSERWAWERLRSGIEGAVDTEQEREWSKSRKVEEAIKEAAKVL